MLFELTESWNFSIVLVCIETQYIRSQGKGLVWLLVRYTKNLGIINGLERIWNEV
jgi:hypothetical protein